MNDKAQNKERIEQELDCLFCHLHALDNQAGNDKNIAQIERRIADLQKSLEAQ
tara:strand:- start:119 stop:277 length:159 start_codon:yes stop_codon:yes gene_type:complete